MKYLNHPWLLSIAFVLFVASILSIFFFATWILTICIGKKLVELTIICGIAIIGIIAIVRYTIFN